MQPHQNMQPSFQALTEAVGRRAENMFATRQLDCAEAVLTVMNRVLGGGLPEAAAVGLASGLSEGIGGSGCTCGAISGAVLAIGLFLGPSGPGIGNKRVVKAAAAELHDAFRKRFGAACCRALTQSKDVGSAQHFKRCADRTGWAAQTASAAVLLRRPELAEAADWPYLRQNDSVIRGRLNRLCGLVAGTLSV
jgi:C_GCAxxG_C_C family probable redox protein